MKTLSNENIFYIYVHKRKTDSKIFYVGKGKNKRAWSTDRKNNHWDNVVNKHGFYVEILESNLTEENAFLLEKEFISLFTKLFCPLTNKTNGGEGTSGFKRTEEHTKKLLAACSKSNSKPFSFINSVTGEIWQGDNLRKACKKRNIPESVNDNLRRLRRKELKSSHNWVVYEQ
jgi:hypothetical protein